MVVFGLTGGVGMGKSTAAAILARRGVAVTDTDELARELVAPGQPALAEIRRVFGESIIDEREELRRRDLAQIVFNDSAKRQQLEGILHPRIRERWLRQIAAWRSEGRGMAAVVIPLLFETNAQNHFDYVVCVACSPGTQQRRLASRGWTSDAIGRRIAAQLPVEEKIIRSHFLVWTEPSLAIHEQQVHRILQMIRPS